MNTILLLVGVMAVTVVVARYAKGLLWILAPLFLLPFIGLQLELLGFALAMVMLNIDLPQRWQRPFVSHLRIGAAALVAAIFGFRIYFITNPAGGFYFFSSLTSILLAACWIFVITRSREELTAQKILRPFYQVLIDLILVVNALVLIFLLPTRVVNPFAAYLSIVLLGMLIGITIISFNGTDRFLSKTHRSIAFSLALCGIAGVIKIPLSLIIVVPLVMATMPMMTKSHAIVAQSAARYRNSPLLRWLVAIGYKDELAAVISLLLLSALSVGFVIAATVSPIHGLIPLLIIPLLWLLHYRQKRAPFIDYRRVCYADGKESILFGIPFDNLTLQEATDQCLKMVNQKGERSQIVVTPNSVSLIKAERTPRLKETYRQADLVLPDGVGIIWATRLFGANLRERVTGIDLVNQLCARSAEEGQSIYLLGSKPGTAKRAGKNLTTRFPKLKISGTHHGYFKDSEQVLAEIDQVNPDILLVGMGVPRQEYWMAQHRAKLNVPVMIGVGGTLDVLAGDFKRAPIRWQQARLEWLYRLIQEPQRLREMFAIPRFITRVLVSKIAVALLLFGTLREES
ncbi:WecB/TagA/CpsF family glycosyltransferase [Candidatus Acetothermia bacterium]|nr:WecB/TagA/CpsF family glycosyltransferase [Candidatus Acetothermia bacterium]